MRFHRDSATIRNLPARTVLTIGNFDGIHLGHQMIIREVVERAGRRGCIPALMTFDPPPSRVLGRATLPQIMTLRDKCAVAGELGVELFVCETFNLALASMPPEVFMREILEERLNPVEILVGYDFAFGKQRRGDVGMLRSYFEPRGCQVDQFRPLRARVGQGEEGIVSSTRIRELLLEGSVRQAGALLGRPHFVSGPVVHGDARGRRLGFPTANLSVENLLPANGVYAVRARFEGRVWPGVANVGRRPTFRGAVVRVEVHLLDYEGDLYEKRLCVEFIERLRGERRFEGVEGLKRQIERDIRAARRLLGARYPETGPSCMEGLKVGACG